MLPLGASLWLADGETWANGRSAPVGFVAWIAPFEATLFLLTIEDIPELYRPGITGQAL